MDPNRRSYDEDGRIQSAPHNDTVPQNPWTTALGVIGVGAVLIGIMVYAAGYSSATSEPDLFEEYDPTSGFAAMFAGEMLILGGALPFSLWLAVLAMQWYRRHETTT